MQAGRWLNFGQRLVDAVATLLYLPRKRINNEIQARVCVGAFGDQAVRIRRRYPRTHHSGKHNGWAKDLFVWQKAWFQPLWVQKIHLDIEPLILPDLAPN